jgi:crotonobetaine/carnitine-CoA ligase
MEEPFSVPDFLEQSAHRWPDAVWLRTQDGAASRREVLDAARCAAGGLAERGVGAGDHVVLVLANGIPFVQSWFGVMLRGAVAVAVNPRAAEAELPAVLATTQATLVVAAADVPVPAGTARVTPDELGAAAPIEAPASCTPDQPAGYIQSSGSTGKPKFVIQSHAMYTMAAESFPWWLGLTSDDVLLTTLPQSHLNAQTYSTLGSFGCGAQLVLLPRFSARSFWRDAKAYGVTQFNAIGAMLEILLTNEPSPEERDHRVRLCYTGPAPTEARQREMEDRFGIRVVVGYALSESPFGLITPIDEPVRYTSMGRPRQHPRMGRINEARLGDPADGDVPTGAVAELLLRNPATTPGYFGDPEQTARVLRDGWLHTGDLVYTDEDGHYYFAGRLKEIIRHRGENLSPAEVENALGTHPAVSSTAVVGVPSPLTEEDVKAFVLLTRPGAVDAAELAAWCESRLPSYKRPRYYEFVEEWPLTETQKIAKTLLPRERTDREHDVQSAGIVHGLERLPAAEERLRQG